MPKRETDQAPASAAVPVALRPVRLPEFGDIEVGWAMCRNTMCRNFGLLYQHPGRGGHVEGRYTLRWEGDQVVGLECEWCGQKVHLHAAQSIRPLARHFLSESLPFADCPHETCDQHGRNAFETLPRSGVRGGAYRQATPHDLRCTVCLTDCPDEDCPNEPRGARRCPKGKACPNIPFPTGTALGLSDRPKVRRSVDAIIHSVGEGRTVTDARASGIPVGSYYRRLQRISARLGNYHAYRNAFLLKPGAQRQSGLEKRVNQDKKVASARAWGGRA